MKLLNYLWMALALLALTALTACETDEADDMEADPVVQEAAEPEWTPLFDGTSFAGWHGLGRDEIPSDHWVVEDGTIRKVASGEVPVQADGQPLEGGDIITDETYDDFEFAFEWKVSEGANSGVKYNVSEDMSTANEPVHAALGFEYQVLDDANHPDAQTERGHLRVSGALYDMIQPTQSAARPVGEWNEGRIIFNGNHGEHWLNGVKVVEYDLDSARFDSLLAESKYAPVEDFAARRSGHIVLQDHGDNVWYRNLRIRDLSPM